MTLILTVGDAPAVGQSSDYQLTDQLKGTPVSDRVGSKQLQASFNGLDLRLAFTGIAAVGSGSAQRRTVDWLSDELKALPYDSQLQAICDALRKRSATITNPHGLRGVLELILTVASVGNPFRIAVISNVDWSKCPPEAKPQFSIQIHTVTKPFHLISGYRDSVPELQKHKLRALAKEIGHLPEHTLEALAEINAIAAKHSRGYVSEACWVTSQTADGSVRRSAGRNMGQHEGIIPSLVGGVDVSEWIKNNFRAAPSKEITIVQTAGVTCGPGDATPMPPPSGEPRQFTLSGSSVATFLRSSEGHQCVTIDISQLQCAVEMCRNQEVTVPFATLALRGTVPTGRNFPRPLLPWRQLGVDLMIDDAGSARLGICGRLLD